jgi:L-lactate dehydrogenase complex protein LldE
VIVQLMVTCLIDSLAPGVGFAVVRVLERAGVTVEVPREQTCCGQPAFNAGCWDDARAMARHVVDVFGRSEAPVVVPSGSCGDMVIHQAPHLLADDPDYGDRAKALAARTY